MKKKIKVFRADKVRPELKLDDVGLILSLFPEKPKSMAQMELYLRLAKAFRSLGGNIDNLKKYAQ